MITDLSPAAVEQYIRTRRVREMHKVLAILHSQGRLNTGVRGSYTLAARISADSRAYLHIMGPYGDIQPAMFLNVVHDNTGRYWLNMGFKPNDHIFKRFWRKIFSEEYSIESAIYLMS